MERISRTDYYLNIAKDIASRSTCLRRKYGVVIVNNDEIISTGYNGSPRGVSNCCDNNFCLRQELNVNPGEKYELCRSVHAEQNAIISANRKDMIGGILYLVGLEIDGSVTKYNRPCKICARMIINSGINTVITLNPDNTHTFISSLDLIYEMNDECIQLYKKHIQEKGE